MIKVLHVIYSLEIGGAQRLVSDLLPTFKLQGINVSILVNHRVNNSFEKKLEESLIPIIPMDIKGNYSPIAIFKIYKIIKEFDIVNVHLFPNLYYVAIASLFLSSKLVYTEHNTTNRRRSHRWLKIIERCIYKQYNKIVSVSNETDYELKRWLGVDKTDNRFQIIRNGVDLSRFTTCNAVNPYPVTLIMISRFSDAKDQQTVIRAISLLDNNVHIFFVGDGPTRKSCEELSQRLCVKERCHFVGEQQNVSTWIAKANIGIHSSHWEGQPLSPIEMMAGGLPVIASDVDGLKQVVEGAGIVFEHGNDKDLARAVNDLIGDRDYYFKISEACKTRSEEYSIKKTAQAYLELYNDLT